MEGRRGSGYGRRRQCEGTRRDLQHVHRGGLALPLFPSRPASSLLSAARSTSRERTALLLLPRSAVRIWSQHLVWRRKRYRIKSGNIGIVLFFFVLYTSHFTPKQTVQNLILTFSCELDENSFHRAYHVLGLKIPIREVLEYFYEYSFVYEMSYSEVPEALRIVRGYL